MKTICIYHGNCADGFAAACVVKKFFDTESLKDGEDTIEFHPGIYQNPPPDVKGKNVILVDFSYKRHVIQEMLESAVHITIIDHHKTAIDDLQDLNHARLNKYFDLNHSGAMLAWLYYFCDDALDKGDTDKAPLLLKHIEDRDLWKFKLPGTREIQAALFSYEYDFYQWMYFIFGDIPEFLAEQDIVEFHPNPTIYESTRIKALELAGGAIERKHFKDIHELLSVAQSRAILCDHNIPICNLPYIHSSDAGNIMAKGEPFAACWMATKEGIVFSLRSITGEENPKGIDVSEIAKLYGGGGHKNAAGFRIPRELLSWNSDGTLVILDPHRLAQFDLATSKD